ncbi:hypothetical protein GWI33_015060 [Rhynchophorus ferrugineus]|uniref:Uncharacterized protein n=1 Tax=Rhynchophorus ferrugineus TaxID=354439 RepID=A0A834MA44_RHYFE|nr:hypothetical protein GWI33_015060 [Rhynchophorus ferrugineus]
MCCKQKTALSRWGYFLGLVAMTMLLTAFVSGSWIYTKEPLPLEKLPIRTTISFKIGLWRVCPTVKRINSTILMIPAANTLVRDLWFPSNP